MKAGARSAEAIIKMLDGAEPERYKSVADGAVYSRFDQSVCIEEGKEEIKGVIFDLDDTLYNEKDYVKSGFKAVSDYLGGGFEKALWDNFEAGKPAIDIVLAEQHRETEKDEALNVYRFHKPDIHLDEKTHGFITNLVKSGIKVGIITDGRPEGQRNKLLALGLSELIGEDNIIITDELGGEQFRKPCDIAFRIMQRRWKLPFEQILYIGDNPHKDFQAPRQLGMRGILFNNKDGLYRTQSDIKEMAIDSITELEEVL